MLKYLLYPLGFIYGSILSIRRWFYRKGWMHVRTFDLPIVSVGNLSVGGTGKTPHVEFLIHHFEQIHYVATMSRGYGRQSNGFFLASQLDYIADFPLVLGDEPTQLVRKFPNIEVGVCEKRDVGIEKLLTECPHLNLIILDDAYQHLRVKRDCNILLTDYARPFYKDFPLPAGRLREFRKVSKYADIIIVTKCPERLTEKERDDIIDKIAPLPSQELFFSTIKYNKPTPLNELSKNIILNSKTPVIAIAGIADPEPFFQELLKRFELVRNYQFRDHYHFKKQDVENIIQENRLIIEEGAIFITTDKDATRLLSNKTKKIVSLHPFFTLPIRVEILFNEEEKLLKKIDSYVTKN